MQQAVSSATNARQWLPALASPARVEAPTAIEWGAALTSSILLILSFPNFNVWPLAWLGLAPLFVVIALRPAPRRAFMLAWFAGAVFFYGSCYWLTYSMIHYGLLSWWLAYLLLVPGALVLGLFPAAFALLLARAVRRWRVKALFLAPFIWTSLEWSRLKLSGQLWNAIGYSQAYQQQLIQPARWGGVYLVGFLILTINAAIAFAIVNRCLRALAVSACIAAGVVVALLLSSLASGDTVPAEKTVQVFVVALQPNVPMESSKSVDELQQLTSLHVSASESALQRLPADGTPRLVIWPESPMNFAYGIDSQFRELVASFAQRNHTAVLFNSQEPAPGNGSYNSALLINEEGRLIAQYDKIRLLPFGEYVPLPHWLPGASLITAMVGDFTPGTRYTLMPVGPVRAGVFICVESAYPSLARTFASEGADVLINISNDGYLGPTAVMRQHLANAIFRAVENDRPLLRVTNTGISAYITRRGEVKDATEGFQKAVRTWDISRSESDKTFYTKHGDVFAGFSATISVLILVGTLRRSSNTRG